MFNLSTEQYISLAQQIVDSAHQAFRTNIYTIEQVELICALRDHHDGKGAQFASVAALRNPVDNSYDIRVDIVGGPEEALNELLKMLDVMIDKKEDSKKILLN
jgi:hypothetical protein